MRTNHRWTDEERDIVRRDYHYTSASAQEIADRLSRMTGEHITEYAVKGQISAMGIAKRSDRRSWTPEEDELLRELAHQYCPRRIKRIMHRSLNSVVVRMKRLHLSRRVRDGWYTKREVCEILGMDHKWVQRRIDSGALKAEPHDPEAPLPKKNGGSCWHITEKDLAKFIVHHPQELNGRNVDLIIVVDLLVRPKIPLERR